MYKGEFLADEVVFLTQNGIYLVMCDTFVAVGSASETGATIFGKNSDRPEDEVQLVIFLPEQKRTIPSSLQCTYITIPQVPLTHGILLSQPYWMWGGEMGVNDKGVAIGNEAVWTTEPIAQKGLLGMDLVRLGLERGNSAKMALDVITSLIEKFGQGGNCACDGSMHYHNSFLIADSREAWVLETAGKWWVAEQITDGVRNISNNLSISNNGTLCHKDLIEFAIKSNLCRDESSFNFAKIFTTGYWTPNIPPTGREGRIKFMLEKMIGDITPIYARGILDDHTGGVCMHGGFISAGSQISTLSQKPDLTHHWFTITAPPCKSVYLPFTFDNACRGLTNPGPHKDINESWIWVIHQKFFKTLTGSEAENQRSKIKGLDVEYSRKSLDYKGNINQIVRDHNELFQKYQKQIRSNNTFNL